MPLSAHCFALDAPKRGHRQAAAFANMTMIYQRMARQYFPSVFACVCGVLCIIHRVRSLTHMQHVQHTQARLNFCNALVWCGIISRVRELLLSKRTRAIVTGIYKHFVNVSVVFTS